MQQVQEDLQPGRPALQPCVKVYAEDEQQVAVCSPQMFLSILEALRYSDNEVRL